MDKPGGSTDLDQALLVGAEFIFGSSVSDWVGRGRPILDGHNWEAYPHYCVACEPSRRQAGLVFRVWQGSSRNMSILAWVLNSPVDTPTSSYWPTQRRLLCWYLYWILCWICLVEYSGVAKWILSVNRRSSTIILRNVLFEYQETILWGFHAIILPKDAIISPGQCGGSLKS